MVNSSDIHQIQEDLKKQCEEEVISALEDSGSAESVKSWLIQVLQEAIEGSRDENHEPAPPDSIELKEELAEKVITAITKIFSAGKHLVNDIGLYYLSDVGTALNLPPVKIGQLLDDELYLLRKGFSQDLLEELDTDQSYWCALILMSSISADDLIHSNEVPYLEIVKTLIRNDPAKLEQLKKDVKQPMPSPYPTFQLEHAKGVFKYIVEIVMCDGEYVDQESRFVKSVGKNLGFDQNEQDQILQPVASTFMVKQSLFPNE